jgi:hypothetical protein
MPNDELIARLARACAHGTRQIGFVNELLAGPSYVELSPYDYVKYGDSELGGKSWMATKKRLIANGFIIKMGPWHKNRRTVEMRFSV